MIIRFFGVLVLSCFVACSKSEVEEALEIVEGVPRKTIDTSRLGVNAFVNDNRFGSIRSQFLEVRDTLGLRFVRVLFGWDDNVQPTPGSSPNYSFYDSILNRLPDGMDALVILTGVPSWMSDSANWIDGNPRTTFVERWVRPAVERYGGNGKVVGFQIWNEPNMASDPKNDILGLTSSPENYVEMLAAGFSVIEDVAPARLVLNAATTAISQNFPDTVNYNRGMRDAGAREFVDIWAIHYYGRQFENVVQDGGVRDFLNGLGMTIWVTESGRQGVNEQLPYGEQVWPFIREKIPNIDRIYVYQFAEPTPPGSTFGLRNLSSDFPVSDLYVHLRERNQG